MTRCGRVRGWSAWVLGLALVMAPTACGDPSGTGGGGAGGGSSSSSSSPPTSTTDTATDGPPPPPTTDCLPETPVELDVGPYLLGCAITPFAWKVTNLSRTIVRLGPAPAAQFADVTQPAAGDPVEEILSVVYGRYRHSYDTYYYLKPDDTVSVTWASGPGELSYQAVPDESVAYTATVEAATGFVAKARGSNAQKAAALDGCLTGVRDSLASRLSGPDLPAEDTWNTYVADAFTASSCVDVLDDDTKKIARQKVSARVSPLWDDLKVGWATIFKAIYRRV